MNRTSFCALALLMGATAPAAAQPTFAGSEIRIKLRLPDDEPGTFRDPVDDNDLEDFYNIANCVCGTEFAVELHLPNGDTTVNEDGELWVGRQCESATDLEAREQQCVLVTSFSDVVDDLRAETDVPVNAGDFMFPNSDTCEFEEEERGAYLLIDDENPNDSMFQASANAARQIDTNPPPVPTDVRISGGEGSLVVSWDAPESRREDVEDYQFLCARADGMENDNDPFPSDDSEPLYLTGLAQCGVDDGITGPDFAPTAPEPLRQLDPAFICGRTTQGTQSVRLEGLENGVDYYVVMVVVDPARNGTAVDVGSATPQPVRDFWEDYKEKGGGAEGGVCLINSTYGDGGGLTSAMRDFRDGTLASAPFGEEIIRAYYAITAPVGELIRNDPALRAVAQVALLPLVALAALWHVAGTPGMLAILLLAVAWRMRREASPRGRREASPRGRRRIAAAAVATAVVLAVLGGQAAAQGHYEPYWEGWDDTPTTALGPAIPKWNVEIKAGPYLPAIDEEFEGTDGQIPPFEETFRGKGLIAFVVELQRFFWYPEGQLGVAASAGIMGRSTNSFQVDANGDVVRDADGKAMRSDGNKTRFRMAPMSLGAVYRFTALDERAGVPLVPYAKLGLSYYLWWIREPNGGFARAQKDPDCMDDGCATTRGLGASLGWQASIGLALRAERLDPGAAVNLRNDMGIEHAGFFFEFLYAQVDHFGADDRLKVGDFTWLAGLSFEF